METDSVDYPDLLQVPMCVTSNPSSSTAKGRKHPFLQRSDSTLCLGCPPLDPFDTIMSEALPLADQPHLLQPHSRREDLFGVPRQPTSANSTNVSSQNPLEGLPTRLGLSTRLADNSTPASAPSFSQVIQGPSAPAAENRRSLNLSGPSEPGTSKLDKPKGFNPAGDNQASPVVSEHQIDRAPIIVSPNSQGELIAGPFPKGKEICKSGRSVIVRAGTVSVSIPRKSLRSNN